MNDDQLMDQLLREAMAGDPPQLSAGFDVRVMRRTQPRRLTPAGRLALALYIVVAIVAAVWLMRDLQLTSIVAAVFVTALVGVAASAYGRRLVLGD